MGWGNGGGVGWGIGCGSLIKNLDSNTLHIGSILDPIPKDSTTLPGFWRYLCLIAYCRLDLDM